MFKDIITGEKIIQLTSCYIFTNNYKKHFGKNQKIVEFDKSFSDAPDERKIYELKKHNKFYIKLDNIPLFFSKLAPYLINHKYSLYAHNSDWEYSSDFWKTNKKNNPNIIKIYAQNLPFDCLTLKDFVCLPIGIANSEWKHGNLELFDKYKSNNSKTNLCHFNFGIGTCKTERTICFEKMKKYYKFENNDNQESYVKKLAESKFSICPRGNGIDTHRFWECVYLRTIPIVLDNPFNRYWEAKGIICLIIDDWDDANPECLEKWFNKNKPRLDVLPEVTKLSHYI